MPEHFKALVVILAVASAVFIVSRGAVLAAGLERQHYRDVVLTWFAVTLAAFFAHGFWLFALLVLLWFWLSGARKRNALLMYVAVLMAAPSYLGEQIPGFGSVRSLLYVDYLRILNLVVLLPYCVWLFRKGPAAPKGFRRADLCVALFIIYMTATTALDRPATQTLRASTGWLIDIWIPYYAASRGLRQLADFRRFSLVVVMVGTVIGLLAVFETLWGWLLYESLRSPYGFPPPFYMHRGEGGPLRAFVSAGQPIVLGYMLVITLGLLMYAANFVLARHRLALCAFILGVGLIATFSRGPWIGAVVMIGTFYLFAPGSARWRFVAGILSIVVVVSLTPLRHLIFPYIPFIGEVDMDTISYRQRLWDVSMDTLREHFWFGDRNYLSNPMMEQMRQGQGIIDMVNSYLQYGLEFGVVGAALFVAAVFGPLGYVVSTWRDSVRHGDVECERLGRVLLSVMAGVAVTIATASGLFAIPTWYWLLAGVCVAYGRCFRYREGVEVDTRRMAHHKSGHPHVSRTSSGLISRRSQRPRA